MRDLYWTVKKVGTLDSFEWDLEGSFSRPTLAGLQTRLVGGAYRCWSPDDLQKFHSHHPSSSSLEWSIHSMLWRTAGLVIFHNAHPSYRRQKALLDIAVHIFRLRWHGRTTWDAGLLFVRDSSRSMGESLNSATIVPSLSQGHFARLTANSPGSEI